MNSEAISLGRSHWSFSTRIIIHFRFKNGKRTGENKERLSWFGYI